MSEFKVEETDLYELLGVESTCTTSEIKKAYRKKALDCHPDKNPDDPNAANLFHQLSKVLEILSDEKARRAYDKVLDARKAAALRHRELDSHRKKLKEDLELREKQSASYRSKTNDELLKAEIDRLRKEGSNHLKEEMEYVNNLVRNSKKQCGPEEWESSKHRIKIKWQVDKSDSSNNGGYSQELLQKCLSKYGDIHVLVMSPQRKGSALVEYKTRQGAEMAVLLEKGISKNPLVLKWVNGPPRQSQAKNADSLVKESDLESLVFHKMRQAAERKRLIEQMEAEDKE